MENLEVDPSCPVATVTLPFDMLGSVVHADQSSAVLLAHVIGHTFIQCVSISKLFDQLQKDKSQTDLMSKLARVGMHSPAMQQMGALYDGTQDSMDNTPDIRMFTDQFSGQNCFCDVLQETAFEHQTHGCAGYSSLCAMQA